MQNNLKFLLINSLLVIFLFIGKAYPIEEFNFDITEIEITENGNKFKGLKRGKVNTDNGLIIESDKFEYNKLTNIFNAFGNVKINDQLNDLIIFTNDITYLKTEEKIFTKGKTNGILESKYNFISKNVSLLRNEKEIFSSEYSEIKDDKLTQYNLDKFRYFIKDSVLKGEGVKVISDYTKDPNESDFYLYRDGIFNLKTKNYKASDTKIYLKKNIFGKNIGSVPINLKNLDNQFDFKNDPRLYGLSSSKKGQITTINKATFTSCGFNDNCPPWNIEAKKITHDRNKRQLIYDNAFLKVYNFPVLYFPKFFHPDPTVKRQSGFLKPQINDSEILGSSILVPYFHVISDNKDMTITPTIFNSNIKMLQTEFRQQNKFSNFITDIAHVSGYKSSLSEKNNSISHLFAKYNLNLDLPKFNYSALNLNLEKITNDTYLKIFDTNLIDKEIKPQSQNKLNSNLRLYFNTDEYNLETGISAYENLSGTNNDRYQFILPYYNFSKNLGAFNLGNLNFSSNGYNNLQNTNSVQSVLNNDLSFLSNNFFTKNGLQNNFGVYFKNLNSLGKNYSNYKNSPQSEISSIYNFETSYPLIKLEDNYTNYFTPKLSFRFNPGDMKDYSSSNRPININNIFSIDRLSIGTDSFEAGKSLTAGIKYTKENINDINKYFSYSLATVFRDKDEEKIPDTSTIGNKSSNLIGSAEYSLSENYMINYDFSLDNNLNNFERNSIAATFTKNNFMTKFNFIEENGKIGQTNSIENTTEFKFADDNYFYFNTRRNRETSLTEYYDLIYEYKNDCLTANIKYKKTYYQDRDLTPDEQIFFTITLFPLSTFEQKVDPGIYRNN